jgi:hypothetical protein
MPVEEYLTISELAPRLKLSQKSIRNKMASGIFRRGVHYFSPGGIGPRFKWSAVVQWLEQGETAVDESNEPIPMPRHYRIRAAQGKKFSDAP